MIGEVIGGEAHTSVLGGKAPQPHHVNDFIATLLVTL